MQNQCEAPTICFVSAHGMQHQCEAPTMCFVSAHARAHTCASYNKNDMGRTDCLPHRIVSALGFSETHESKKHTMHQLSVLCMAPTICLIVSALVRALSTSICYIKRDVLGYTDYLLDRIVSAIVLTRVG